MCIDLNPNLSCDHITFQFYSGAASPPLFNEKLRLPRLKAATPRRVSAGRLPNGYFAFTQ
jgi:hypothetical protein